MRRIRPLDRTSSLALRKRKAHLLRSFSLPPDLLHASVLERFMKCGKANCRCHAQGPKHGPFFYLNRCFAQGKLQSFLLKGEEQVARARRGIAVYGHLLEVLDEISQINYELLRRGEPLPAHS